MLMSFSPRWRTPSNRSPWTNWLSPRAGAWTGSRPPSTTPSSTPRIAGPVALRRTEPGTYTVTARLDRLTTAQRHNLAQVHLYRNPLTPEQANALLAVLAVRSAPEDYLTHRQDHLNAERVSNAPASSTPSTNPTTPRLTPTCFYSRRYQNALADH